MDMKLVVAVCLPALLLAACGGVDKRYRDTEMLERPPVLAKEKSLAPDAVIVEDDSAIPKKKHKKGLEDDVYMTKSTPPVLNIKQPFASAWDTLNLGLAQSEITVTDRVRDKGLIFVSYNPKTLFGAVSSWLTKEEKQIIYVLTLEANGQETQINIKKASSLEQSTSLEPSRIDQKSTDQEAADDAEALLYQLYGTLHDDLRAE